MIDSLRKRDVRFNKDFRVSIVNTLKELKCNTLKNNARKLHKPEFLFQRSLSLQGEEGNTSKRQGVHLELFY